MDVNRLNEQLTFLNKQLTEFKNDSQLLKELQEKYPPVQTQQLIFGNVSSQEVNQAIQTAISSNSKSYGVSFVIGSLFGSLLSLSFVYKFFMGRVTKNV